MRNKSATFVLALACAAGLASAQDAMTLRKIGEQTSGGSLAPDGKTVLLLRGGDPIYRLDLATGKESLVLKGKKVVYARVDPAGKRIVFMGDAANRDPECYSLWTVGADGKGLQPFCHSKATKIGDCYPIWSPDGSSIAWVREGAVWIAKADGSGARVVVAKPEEGFEIDATLDWMDDRLLLRGYLEDNGPAEFVFDLGSGELANTGLRQHSAQFCETADYLIYGWGPLRFWSVDDREEAYEPVEMDESLDNCAELTRSVVLRSLGRFNRERS